METKRMKDDACHLRITAGWLEDALVIGDKDMIKRAYQQVKEYYDDLEKGLKSIGICK